MAKENTSAVGYIGGSISAMALFGTAAFVGLGNYSRYWLNHRKKIHDATGSVLSGEMRDNPIDLEIQKNYFKRIFYDKDPFNANKAYERSHINTLRQMGIHVDKNVLLGKSDKALDMQDWSKPITERIDQNFAPTSSSLRSHLETAVLHDAAQTAENQVSQIDNLLESIEQMIDGPEKIFDPKFTNNNGIDVTTDRVNTILSRIRVLRAHLKKTAAAVGAERSKILQRNHTAKSSVDRIAGILTKQLHTLAVSQKTQLGNGEFTTLGELGRTLQDLLVGAEDGSTKGVFTEEFADIVKQREELIQWFESTNKDETNRKVFAQKAEEIQNRNAKLTTEMSFLSDAQVALQQTIEDSTKKINTRLDTSMGTSSKLKIKVADLFGGKVSNQNKFVKAINQLDRVQSGIVKQMPESMQKQMQYYLRTNSSFIDQMRFLMGNGSEVSALNADKIESTVKVFGKYASDMYKEVADNPDINIHVKNFWRQVNNRVNGSQKSKGRKPLIELVKPQLSTSYVPSAAVEMRGLDKLLGLDNGRPEIIDIDINAGNEFSKNTRRQIDQQVQQYITKVASRPAKYGLDVRLGAAILSDIKGSKSAKRYAKRTKQPSSNIGKAITEVVNKAVTAIQGFESNEHIQNLKIDIQMTPEQAIVNFHVGKNVVSMPIALVARNLKQKHGVLHSASSYALDRMMDKNFDIPKDGMWIAQQDIALSQSYIKQMDEIMALISNGATNDAQARINNIYKQVCKSDLLADSFVASANTRVHLLEFDQMANEFKNYNGWVARRDSIRSTINSLIAAKEQSSNKVAFSNRINALEEQYKSLDARIEYVRKLNGGKAPDSGVSINAIGKKLQAVNRLLKTTFKAHDMSANSISDLYTRMADINLGAFSLSKTAGMEGMFTTVGDEALIGPVNNMYTTKLARNIYYSPTRNSVFQKQVIKQRFFPILDAFMENDFSSEKERATLDRIIEMSAEGRHGRLVANETMRTHETTTKDFRVVNKTSSVMHILDPKDSHFARGLSGGNIYMDRTTAAGLTGELQLRAYATRDDFQITSEKVKAALEQAASSNPEEEITKAMMDGNLYDPTKTLLLNRNDIVGLRNNKKVTAGELFGDRMSGDSIYVKAAVRGNAYEFTGFTDRAVGTAGKTDTKLTILESLTDGAFDTSLLGAVGPGEAATQMAQIRNKLLEMKKRVKAGDKSANTLAIVDFLERTIHSSFGVNAIQTDKFVAKGNQTQIFDGMIGKLTRDIIDHELRDVTGSSSMLRGKALSDHLQNKIRTAIGLFIKTATHGDDVRHAANEKSVQSIKFSKQLQEYIYSRGRTLGADGKIQFTALDDRLDAMLDEIIDFDITYKNQDANQIVMALTDNKWCRDRKQMAIFAKRLEAVFKQNGLGDFVYQNYGKVAAEGLELTNAAALAVESGTLERDQRKITQRVARNKNRAYGLFATNAERTEILAYSTAMSLSHLAVENELVAKVAGSDLFGKMGGIQDGVVANMWDITAISRASPKLADRIMNANHSAVDRIADYMHAMKPLFNNTQANMSDRAELAKVIAKDVHDTRIVSESQFIQNMAVAEGISSDMVQAGNAHFRREFIVAKPTGASVATTLENLPAETLSYFGLGETQATSLGMSDLFSAKQIENVKNMSGKYIRLNTVSPIEYNGKMMNLDGIYIPKMFQFNGDGFMELGIGSTGPDGTVLNQKAYAVSPLAKSILNIARALSVSAPDERQAALNMAVGDYFKAMTDDLGGKGSLVANKGIKVALQHSAAGLAQWGNPQLTDALHALPDGANRNSAGSMSGNRHIDPFYGMQKIYDGKGNIQHVTPQAGTAFVSEDVFRRLTAGKWSTTQEYNAMLESVRTGRRTIFGVMNRQSTMNEDFWPVVRINVMNNEMLKKASANSSYLKGLNSQIFTSMSDMMLLGGDTDADRIAIKAAVEHIVGVKDFNKLDPVERELMAHYYDSFKMRVINEDGVEIKNPNKSEMTRNSVIDFIGGSGNRVKFMAEGIKTSNAFSEFTTNIQVGSGHDLFDRTHGYSVYDMTSRTFNAAGKITDHGLNRDSLTYEIMREKILKKLGVKKTNPNYNNIVQHINNAIDNILKTKTSDVTEQTMADRVTNAIRQDLPLSNLFDGAQENTLESTITTLNDNVSKEFGKQSAPLLNTQDVKKVVQESTKEVLDARNERLVSIAEAKGTTAAGLKTEFAENMYALDYKAHITPSLKEPAPFEVDFHDWFRKSGLSKTSAGEMFEWNRRFSQILYPNFTNEKNMTPHAWRSTHIQWANVDDTLKNMKDDSIFGLSKGLVGSVLKTHSRVMQQKSMSAKHLFPIVIGDYIDITEQISGVKSLQAGDPNAMFDAAVDSKTRIKQINSSMDTFEKLALDAHKQANDQFGNKQPVQRDLSYAKTLRESIMRHSEKASEIERNRLMAIYRMSTGDFRIDKSMLDEETRNSINAMFDNREIGLYEYHEGLDRLSQDAKVRSRLAIHSQSSNKVVAGAQAQIFALGSEAALKSPQELSFGAQVGSHAAGSREMLQSGMKMLRAGLNVLADTATDGVDEAGRRVTKGEAAYAFQHHFDNMFSKRNESTVLRFFSDNSVVGRVFQEALVKARYDIPKVGQVAVQQSKHMAMPAAALVTGAFLLTQALHPKVAPELGDTAGRGGEYYEKLRRKEAEERFNPVEETRYALRHKRNISYVLNKMVSTKTAWTSENLLMPTYTASDAMANNQYMSTRSVRRGYANNDRTFYKRVTSLSN